jgi:tetratricopeptide (TPR) repeat protein
MLDQVDLRRELACESALVGLADDFYALSVNPSSHGDPTWQSGYRGRAELVMARMSNILSDWYDASGLRSEARDLKSEASELCKIELGGDRKVLKLEGSRLNPPEQRPFTNWPPLIQPRPPLSAQTLTAAQFPDPLARRLASRVEDLETVAGVLEQQARALSQDALKHLKDAIRMQPDSADLHSDLAIVYLWRLQVDRAFGERLRLIASTANDLQDIKADKDRIAKESDRFKDAVGKITDGFIDGSEKWPPPLQRAPKDVLQRLGDFWGAADHDEPDDSDVQKQSRYVAASLRDAQVSLSDSEDLKELMGAALKACDLTAFRDVEALRILARAYAVSGDFRNAEYYQNRAAYYALDDPRFDGQRTSLLLTREEYRRFIPPEGWNKPWKDASKKLDEGLPAIK